MPIILLLVDIQNALVGQGPYGCRRFTANLQGLLEAARKRNIAVCHVRHDGGPGDELEKHSAGWEIYPGVAPAGTEKVFDKTRNSAFKDTGLHQYLQEQGISTIVLAGMQTEYCIDATCKSAFDLGYSVVIPKGCTTTFDNEYFSGETLSRYFEEKIWDGRFARVLPLSDDIFTDC